MKNSTNDHSRNIPSPHGDTDLGTDPLTSRIYPASLTEGVTCRPRRTLPITRRRPLDFSSPDTLNLAAHPHIVMAGCKLRSVTPKPRAPQHPAVWGAEAAEQRLARFLGMTEACLFPTADGARRHLLRSLAGAGDHILIDALVPAPLMAAALATEARVHRVPHGWTECFANRLRQIRLTDRAARIVVVSEALHSYDNTPADLAALQTLCRQNGAVLAVDATGDLGLVGRTGRGVAEMQEMIGGIDVLMGDLAQTFLAPCGFAAALRPQALAPLRTVAADARKALWPSPEHDGLLARCIDLVESGHGAWRRARVMSNALRLSEALVAEGFKVPGRAGPVVPVNLGDPADARRMTDSAKAAGCVVDLVEYEVGGRKQGYWQLHVMADHTSETIDTLIGIIARARRLNSDALGVSAI
jgi:7-keto-8-aminopelargonate synthetase-like enzyme